MAMSDCAKISIRIWHLRWKFIITFDALVEIRMRVESCQVIFFVVVHVITNCLTLWLATIITMDKWGYWRWKFVFLWFIAVFKYLFQIFELSSFLSLILFCRRCFKRHHIVVTPRGKFCDNSWCASLPFLKKIRELSESYSIQMWFFLSMAFELWFGGTAVLSFLAVCWKSLVPLCWCVVSY